MTSLFQQYFLNSNLTTPDYKTWKRHREQVIQELKECLLNLPESDIVLFYMSLEKNIKNHSEVFSLSSDKSGEISRSIQKEILQCLLELSILYHFQRNQDISLPYFQVFISRVKEMKNDGKLVAKAISKTFYWLAVDSNEANQAFKDLLDFSKKTLHIFNNQIKLKLKANQNLSGTISNSNISLASSVSNSSNSFDASSFPVTASLNSDFTYTALIILKRVRKLSLSNEIIQIIFNYFPALLKIAASADKECQKIAMKLFEFQFNHVERNDLEPKLSMFEERMKKYFSQSLFSTAPDQIRVKPHKIYCAIRFYTFLLNFMTKEKDTSYENLYNFNDFIDKLEEHKYFTADNEILNAFYNLIIKAIEKLSLKAITINIDKLFDLFYRRFTKFRDPETVFQKLVTTIASSQDINNDTDQISIEKSFYQVVIDFIYKLEDDRSQKFKNQMGTDRIQLFCSYKKGYVCPFCLLLFFLERFPSSSKLIDLKFTNTTIICKHYIKCMFLCPSLLTEKVKEHFKYAFVSKNQDTELMTAALLMYPLCPDIFVLDDNGDGNCGDEVSNCEKFLKKLIVLLSVSDDSKFRRQIIKTLPLFDDYNEARKMILMSSLVDDNEKNRLLAMEFLKPDSVLAMEMSVMHYIADPSPLVRKSGIKLISKIYEYNPLCFRPMIIEYLHQIFLSIETTTNVNESANFAQFLEAVTKHCKKIIADLAPTIICVCLKLINSSGTSGERRNIFTYSQFINNISKNNNTNNSSNNMNLQNKQIQVNQQHSIDHLSYLLESPKSPALIQAGSLNSLNQNQNQSTQNNQNQNNQNQNAATTALINSNYSNFPVDLVNPSSPSTSSSLLGLNLPSNFGEEYASTPEIMLKYSLDKIEMPDLLMNEKRSMKEPNKSKLYLIFRSGDIDRRDAYLLKSVSNLGSLCEPYMVAILNAYSNVFQTRTNEDLLISAMKSLTKLSLQTFNGLNIRLRCPQMASPLLQILSTTTNEKLAISILQLFGSAFDSLDILQTQSISTPSDLSAVMAHVPSYATDLAITNIMKYIGEPSLTTLKTFALIVEGDPIYSAKFLPKIALVFHYLLRKGSEMVKNKAFQYLEIIACNTLKDFVQLLPLFLPELQSLMYLESCVHFCTLISYFMKTDFISCSDSILYTAIAQMNTCINTIYQKTTNIPLSASMSSSHILSLSQFTSSTDSAPATFNSNYNNSAINDISLFKSLLQLVASIIIFQHHPFIHLIKALESYVDRNLLNSKLIPSVLHVIISIAQSIDLSMFTSRLVMFALKLHKTQKANIGEFLASLSVFCNLSYEDVFHIFEVSSISFKYLDQLKTYSSMNSNNNNNNNFMDSGIMPKFIKDYRIKFSIPKSFMRLQTEHFFIDMEYPSELHITLWLKNLLRITITKSPSPSIRACSDFLNTSVGFLSKLFPIAFLSCWKKANVADRDHFSNIVDYVLHNHRNVNSAFFLLIQIADKALLPMKVDLAKIAELSSSHQNTMFLLQKKHLCGIDANCKYGNKEKRIQVLMNKQSLKEKKSNIRSKRLSNESGGSFDTNVMPNDNNTNTPLTVKKSVKRPSDSDIQQLKDCQLNIMNIETNSKSNIDLIKMMINVCIKMGRHATARGILKKAEKNISMMDFANWSGELGDWSKALKIYQSINAPLRYVIHSLNNLNRYDDILKYEEQFQQMNENEKMEVIDDFFWPYYLNNNFEKIKETVKKFEMNWTLQRLLNVIFISIDSQNYSHAQELIDLSYRMLAKQSSQYIAGDQNQIEDDQDKAELLIEYQEVLNYKMNKSSSGQTTSFFSRRVKHFKRSRVIWERTIGIREIVVPIQSNLQFYLKIISELRKAKYSSLIDYYFMDKIIHCFDPRVTIQACKIWWEKGDKVSTCIYLDAVCSCIYSPTEEVCFETLKRICSITNAEIKTSHLYSMIQTSSFSNKLKEFYIKKFDLNCDLENFSDFFFQKFDKFTNEQKNFTFNEFVATFPNEACKSTVEVAISHRKDSHFIACANRLAGDYLLSLDPVHSLRKIAQFYKIALDIEPTRPKLWRKWAYVNSSLFTESKLAVKSKSAKNETTVQNQDIYANNAISAFLKLTELVPKDSLEFASQILSILSSSSEHVTSQFINLNLLPSAVIKVLPLITSKLDHPDKNVNSIIERLLTTSSMYYFQEIYFALNLYILSNDEKSIIAQSIVDKIRNYKANAAEDSNLFIDGMIRCALTWFEIWMTSIEEASKYPRQACETLTNLFNMYEKPQCELDHLFIRLYDDFIQCLKVEFLNQKSQEIWSKIRTLYNSLSERVNKLSAIFLSKVSEKLVMKRGFAINAPGTNFVKINSDYACNEINDKYEYENQIYSIEPVLEVLETQQHPRCLFINTRDGKKLKYLLKGSEDLRLDERLMLLFALINGMLCNIDSTKENEVFIARYAVIPLTKTVGLIKWVTGADTMHQMIVENRKMFGISKEIESEVITSFTNTNFIQMNSLQRLEVFEEVLTKTKGQELFEAMWLKSPSAAVWMTRTQKFTLSSSLMSMVGYIIGLGDRHPSNIMVQRETGNIVHIDFCESFEKTLFRKQFPEKVPFRLTRMIINAFEGSIENGLFQEFANEIMKVLRENKETLIAQLTIFVEEPLAHFQKEGGGEKPVELIRRCARKLAGTEISSKYGIINDSMITSPGKKELPVQEQVSLLIDIASDPAYYIRHYPGWCPFW